MAETGCYYYLQEKQKICILSEAQHEQLVRRREAETTLQCCHSLQPLKMPKVWEPCLLSASTQRWGWDTVQEGQRQSPPPTAGSAGSTACDTQGYLKQCFRDMEIIIWTNHGFSHIKKVSHSTGKQFQHTTLRWFQLQGCCVVRYSPAQIQVNCFLSCGQEEQCCQGCLQHPQGPTLGQKHLPRPATEWELPATLPGPQHTLLPRE